MRGARCEVRDFRAPFRVFRGPLSGGERFQLSAFSVQRHIESRELERLQITGFGFRLPVSDAPCQTAERVTGERRAPVISFCKLHLLNR